jgi:hypothetical protein
MWINQSSRIVAYIEENEQTRKNYPQKRSAAL